MFIANLYNRLQTLAFPRSKPGIFDLTLNKLNRFEIGSILKIKKIYKFMSDA